MPITGGMTAAWPTVHAADDVPLDTPRVPAREAAERELSRPMYHENDPNPLQHALDSFWDWVGRVFDSASGAAPGGTVGLVVVAVVVVALAGALWWRLGTPQRALTTSASPFDDRTRSSAEHRSTAEKHAAAGLWNQAVQERMRAIVRSLEERTLLDPRPGRTADEAAVEAGLPLPGHADELRAAARTFDDVTYGGRTADQRAYQRLKDLDTSLERAKPRLSDAAPGTAG
ncbi:DUF4129 domain-containing protein [Streptomyces ficellus]|uniref:DUF4129 domain-containing protein n=1 Tax=Streptomyces ficellus TaxID=1977088 RepID=A0A6I6FTA8_9ACTN|nr:DUF4129 domain-containing protein [Streptomyces ficellus]QGV80316.1 DUF4129 domain-containing protein [Streptomyces ficellus]